MRARTPASATVLLDKARILFSAKVQTQDLGRMPIPALDQTRTLKAHWGRTAQELRMRIQLRMQMPKALSPDPIPRNRGMVRMRQAHSAETAALTKLEQPNAEER